MLPRSGEGPHDCVPKPKIAVAMLGLEPKSAVAMLGLEPATSRRLALREGGEAHRAVKVFALERNAWGPRHAPDAFAEAFLDERPELERLRILVRERRLDRRTARVTVDEYAYDYRRARR